MPEGITGDFKQAERKKEQLPEPKERNPQYL